MTICGDTESGKYGREQAWQLLTEWTQSESLRKHALAVEACVTACGETEADRLGSAGRSRWRSSSSTLPRHCCMTLTTSATPRPRSILLWASASWSGWAGQRSCAQQFWATRNTPAYPRVTHLAKALFACDELAGFLTACALVKPSKAIADVEVKSVRKKMKDKAFARGVNREDVIQGAAELGVDLDAHISFCIEAMKKRATSLGL